MTTNDEFQAKYHTATMRKLLVLGGSIAGVVLTVGLISLSTCQNITLAEAYNYIWNHLIGTEYEVRSQDWWNDRFIWNRSIPRALCAIVAGIGLAAAGVMMQSLMNNPLADPYSTGISSGACFGAVAAIVTGVMFTTAFGDSTIVIFAFIGAMVPAFIIILISSRIMVTPATLILLGTAISYFFNAMITYMMVTTDADSLKSAYLWQIGNLTNVTWSSLPFIALVTIVGSIIIMGMANKLNIMANGDHTAISLGVDIQKFRMYCLLLMAIMTAAVIAYTGIIGFVGLVAPHLVRLIIGGDNKFVVPISMVAGSFIILLADYISFLLSDIPIGVVTCIIGSPLFFILIIWQSKRTGAIY